MIPILTVLTCSNIMLYCAVYNPVLRNVAQNKPVVQISTKSDSNYRVYAASLANDGSRQTNYYRCAASKRETNPWWLVDLGVPTVVCLVKLTNVRQGGDKHAPSVIISDYLFIIDYVIKQ